MFDYYGSKNSLARYYQAPKHNLIIEPFAGSAGYALYHLEQNSDIKAVLIEKAPQVYDAWMWLKEATEKDIDNYPLPKEGEKTTDFFVKASSASNAFLKSSFMTVNARMHKRFSLELSRMKRLLHVMNRIEVINGTYSQAPDIEATWFIDPPYQSIGGDIRGMGYAKGCDSSTINYTELGEWCKSRKGYVIVCEQEGADWLNFRPLRSASNSLDKKYVEVVWTNLPDAQMDMFGFDDNNKYKKKGGYE